ncbi:MAG: hypothetical protein ACD_4C00131G0001 [uncultured bacterium (gcode 4)]|uniref:Uncharacterized protein n=1 Tax=uncultured bacterium (gcode 4) TaxID=1234023 RepID=K2FYB1_9BACT|nr:MAG: hypothetical protein ACD_4C00131G0001 [uncultured bacterium (gcode 4)]
MDAMKQWAEKAKDAAVWAAWEVKEWVGTVGQKIEKKVEWENKNELTSGQAKGVDKVNNDIDLKDKIEKHIKTPENEQWKTEDYLNFIHSPDFQNQKLSNIIYTKNPDANIFTNVGINELWIKIPPNLNPTLLKKVLRSYILGTSKFEWWWLKWDKEKWILLNKYPQKRYENKTFKEFIEELN